MRKDGLRGLLSTAVVALQIAEGLSLGVWLNNTRARRDKLSTKQAGQREALGVAW